jgi:hypothetical protein
MDRRAKLLSEIDLERQTGLELGPLASPIVAKSAGKRVLYVDHCLAPELFAKYDGRIPAEAVAEVDVVWSAGSLLQAVQDQMFDYVVASHVIEHVPDLIGWLREIGSVLRPGGVLALAIPDKRYTFDISRPLSTVGEIVAAHLGRNVVPSVKQVHDNYTMARVVDAARVWDGSQRAETAPYLHSRGAAASFVKRVIGGEYVDCHCWIFTPRSFLDVLRALRGEGFISFAVRRFFDSAAGQNEFIVTLAAHTHEDDSFVLLGAAGDTVDNGLM